MPTLTVKDAFAANVVVNTINNNGQATSANSSPVVLSTAQEAKLDTQITALNSLVTALTSRQARSFYPGATSPPIGELRGVTYDKLGALYTRGGVTTDEGSIRIGYSGVTLSRSIGSCTFTASSRVVTGTGFLTLDPPLLAGDYCRLTADAESAYAQVFSIDSDTQLTLANLYTGVGGTGASDASSLQTVTGAGATLSVSAGALTIACGITAAATTRALHEVGYGPLIYQSGFSVSQRIANQDIYRGLTQPSGARRYFAHFRFSGTGNTTVICETGWAATAPASGSDLQATTITLSNGLTTATTADYRIEVRGELVSFYVNDSPVASHKTVAPRPYDILSLGTIVVNGTTPASNTNVIIAYELCNNLDSLRVSMANNTDQMLAMPPPAQTSTYSVAGVIVINTDLLTIDCSQIAELSIHCQSMGTTGVVTGQWSATPDFAGVQTATLYDQTGTSLTTFSAAGLRKVNRQARYFRLRLTTATTAGTTTIIVTGFPSASSPSVVTQPISATNLSCNNAQINGTTPLMGNGSTGTGSMRVTMASDTTANSNPWLVTPVTSSAQGASTTHHAISAATTNATSVKASAGNANTISCSNANAAVRFLKLYNKASAPTVGTDTPIATIMLRAGENTPVDCGPFGRRFSTGIAYAITALITVADATAVAASEHAVEISYT